MTPEAFKMALVFSCAYVVVVAMLLFWVLSLFFTKKKMVHPVERCHNCLHFRFPTETLRNCFCNHKNTILTFAPETCDAATKLPKRKSP